MKEFFCKDIVTYLNDNIADNRNIASLFDEMEKRFTKANLAFVFSYILENKREYNVLNETIRRINKHKFIQNKDALIDFILLKNTDFDFLNLKVLAIKTLSGYRSPECVPALLFCLNDKNSNYKIRLAAAEALGKIGDKVAFDSLINVVCDDKEKSAYVKESAVTALGMLGDDRALDVFDSIISAKQMFLDKFQFLKEKIIEAMSKFDSSKNAKALEILKKTLSDSSEKIRISAIEAIMNMDVDESYNIIYDCLKYDSSLEVKKNALIALYNLSDRKILDEVIAGDFDDEIIEHAKKLILVYEDKDA